MLLWIVLGVVALGVVAVAALLSEGRTPDNTGAGKGEFTATGRFTVKPLLTDAERAFFVRLRQAVGSELEIFPKVRLIDVVEPRGSGGDRQGARNRVIQKHVDFLLVRASDSYPVAAVELDDRTHGRPDRQERDRLIEEILRSVGLPLIRFRVQADWDPAQVRAGIAEGLKGVSQTNAG